jgi:hypothetical protein
VWSGKLWSHRPLFHWRLKWSYSCSHFARYIEMLQHFCTPELSPPWNWGLNHVVPIRWCNCQYSEEHPWRSFKKYFWSTLLHYAASFHGLHVCLISLPVIISFWGASKWKCTPLDHGWLMTSKSNSEAYFSDTRNMEEWTLGNLPARLEERVCNDGQWWS